MDKTNIRVLFFEVRVACGKSQIFSTISRQQSMNINFKWDQSGSGGLFYLDGNKNHLAMLYDLWSEGGIFNHVSHDIQKLMCIDAWYYAREKLRISNDPLSISLIGHVNEPFDGIVYRSDYNDLNLQKEGEKRGMSEYNFKKLVSSRVNDDLPDGVPTWDVSRLGFNWHKDFVLPIVEGKEIKTLESV